MLCQQQGYTALRYACIDDEKIDFARLLLEHPDIDEEITTEVNNMVVYTNIIDQLFNT